MSFYRDILNASTLPTTTLNLLRNETLPVDCSAITATWTAHQITPVIYRACRYTLDHQTLFLETVRPPSMAETSGGLAMPYRWGLLTFNAPRAALEQFSQFRQWDWDGVPRERVIQLLLAELIVETADGIRPFAMHIGLLDARGYLQAKPVNHLRDIPGDSRSFDVASLLNAPLLAVIALRNRQQIRFHSRRTFSREKILVAALQPEAPLPN